MGLGLSGFRVLNPQKHHAERIHGLLAGEVDPVDPASPTSPSTQSPHPPLSL